MEQNVRDENWYMQVIEIFSRLKKHNYMQWITWNYLSKFKLSYPNTINITEKEVLKRYVEGICGIAKKVYVE